MQIRDSVALDARSGGVVLSLDEESEWTVDRSGSYRVGRVIEEGGIAKPSISVTLESVTCSAGFCDYKVFVEGASAGTMSIPGGGTAQLSGRMPTEWICEWLSPPERAGELVVGYRAKDVTARVDLFLDVGNRLSIDVELHGTATVNNATEGCEDFSVSSFYTNG